MNAISKFQLSYLIRLNKSKNGLAPIYCRINIAGQRAEISLKKYISPDKWMTAGGGRAIGNSVEARVVNLAIEQLNAKIHYHYNQLQASGQKVTAAKIKNLVLELAEKKYTLLEAFKHHNKKMLEVVGIDVELGTYKKFETVQEKITRFLKSYYHVSDIELDDLKFKFVTDFEHFMKTQDKVSHNTALRYIRCLKKIIIMAVNNEWMNKNPFASYKVQFTKVNREILTAEELETLKNKELPNERLNQVKDVFLFCCYTGYAFIDVFKLTRNDLAKGIDGEYWIFTERTKTGIRSNVPLLPTAMEIVEKYYDHPICVESGKLLPVKSNQKMNAYLKEVADLCGIHKNLTMHIARHTFATTVTLSNGVPIETVSKMLGHTKIATTQIYAQVLDNKVSADMQKLKDSLSVINKKKSIG